MPSPFRVIIVGGGPVGLIAAHALSKAGIDFVVLEARPQIAEDVGASLVFLPYTLRMLGQLGLLDGMRERGQEIQRWGDYTEKGLRGQYFPAETMIRNHGSSSLATHRAEIVQFFYDSLSDAEKKRVLLNKKLASIEKVEDGVVVTCVDAKTGENVTVEGSIVLGADGVHSKTRALMREMKLKDNPKAETNEEAPFKAEYKTMWCSFPRRYEYPPGDHCITHGPGASLQFIVHPKRCWVFVYEKLDQPNPHERTRFTDMDLKDFANRHGNMRIGDRLTLADVVPHRTSGGMALLEEGVLQHWSYGRIVLAGDAAHKFTPNAGLGLNNGLQDIAVLLSSLVSLLSKTAPNPSEKELEGVFKRYQDARAKPVQKDFKFSADTTRMAAWPSWGWWLWDWFIASIPGFNLWALDVLASKDFSEAFCFDFLEGKESLMGRVPWVHPIPKPKAA